MKENEYINDFIETHTNKYFYFTDPKPDMICLEDIAHSLAHLCRFNGHCKRFYSVAEHSVLVSHYVPPEYAAEALMHDATEAYYGDISKPIKCHLYISVKGSIDSFEYFERSALNIIFSKYGLKLPLDEVIHKIDCQLLVAEYKILMNKDLPIQLLGITPLKLSEHLIGYSPLDAKRLFINRASEVGIRD